jgi:hypothetical protein
MPWMIRSLILLVVLAQVIAGTFMAHWKGRVFELEAYLQSGDSA